MQCADCGEDMVAGSLTVYQKTYHGVELGSIIKWENRTLGGETQTYRMSFSTTAGPLECPV